jgi:hypothetical protein
VVRATAAASHSQHANAATANNSSTSSSLYLERTTPRKEDKKTVIPLLDLIPLEADTFAAR